MRALTRGLKIGLLILVLGLVFSMASAWCEVQAHVKIAPPVHTPMKGTPTTLLQRETPEYYLHSSMAIRLFCIGALFIVAGTLQIQRAYVSERVARLERELELFRKASAA